MGILWWCSCEVGYWGWTSKTWLQAPVVLCWLIQGSFFLFFNVLVTSQGGGVLAAGWRVFPGWRIKVGCMFFVSICFVQSYFELNDSSFHLFWRYKNQVQLFSKKMLLRRSTGDLWFLRILKRAYWLLSLVAYSILNSVIDFASLPCAIEFAVLQGFMVIFVSWNFCPDVFCSKFWLIILESFCVGWFLVTPPSKAT